MTITEEIEPHPTAPHTHSGADLEILSSSCKADFPVVIDASTGSLIASARLSNVGDLKGVWIVKVQWFPVGRASVAASKYVVISAGDEARVNFRKRVDQGTMTGMVGPRRGDEACRVTAQHVQ